MLVPCWFTLWTSSRFLYPYILLISLEIIIFFVHCSSNINPVERKRQQQFEKDDVNDLHQFEDPDELEFDEVAQPLEKRNCWVIVFIMLLLYLL